MIFYQIHFFFLNFISFYICSEQQQNYMQQQQRLSYFPNLLGQSERVIAQSISNRKQIEEYIEFLSERANVEENYAKQLDKLAVYIDKSTLGVLKDSVLKQLTMKIEFQNNFVELIRSEIVQHCKESIQKQNNIAKKIIDEMKSLEWDLQDRQDDLMNCRLDYKVASRELEQATIVELITLYSKDSNDSQKQKASSKATVLHQDCENFEKEYKLLILQFNEFMDVYNTKLESYLNQLEQQEQERCIILKDTLMKFFMFEMSIAKQQLHDVEKLNENVRRLNLQDSIEEFIKYNQRPADVPKPVQFSPYKSLVLSTLNSIYDKRYETEKSSLDSKSDQFYQIFDEVKAASVQLNEETIQKYSSQQDISGNFVIFCLSILQLWKGEEPFAAALHNILMQNSLNRQLWCIALEIVGNKFGYQLQEESAFALMERWFNSMLKLCIDNLEVAPLRRLLKLSSLIHIVTQKKRFYIASCFQDFKMFQANDFIEAAIIQSMFDALTEEMPAQLIFEEKIKKQKINFISSISSTCFQLLLYNPKTLIKMYAETYMKHAGIVGDAPKQLLDQIEWYQSS